MRRALAGLSLLLLPSAAAALAFEAVDAIPYPSLGEFPAYPAEPRGPGRLFAQIGVERDDNVLREAVGADPETITRLGLGASYEARVVGRQRVLLEARGDLFSYHRFSELDHFAYGVLGEWRWELGNQLSGTLGYGRRRYQTDLAELRAPVDDEITENRVYGTAGYRFMPDWRVRAGFDVIDGERPAARDTEINSQSVAAGLDYVTPLGNALGVEVRSTEGDASVPELLDPAGVFANNDYEETEVALVATYNPGPQLRLGARLGRTERTYSEIPGRNFEGTTGRFDVAWRPGNKTILAFEAYRVPRSIIDVGASHVLVEGVAFGPSWAPTAKLVFTARLVNEAREYSGDPAAALDIAPLRDETVRALRLGAGWEATRRHHLGLAWEHGERSSNVLGRDFDYNTFMANLRYVF
jgi:hypothetical protein